jgi:hypothetical protein
MRFLLNGVTSIKHEFGIKQTSALSGVAGFGDYSLASSGL